VKWRPSPTRFVRRLNLTQPDDFAGLSMFQRIGFDGSGLAATHLQRINNTDADIA
jgi:hypothetical protein